MQRIRHIGGLLLGPALLVTLLAGCGQGTASASGAATATATPTAATLPTMTARVTATPFFVNGVGYQRITDSMFGFSFAIPSDMQLNLQESTPQFGGDHAILMTPDSDQSNGLEIDFGGGTRGFAANQCPQAIPGATIATVGPGIKGYQTNNLVSGSVPPGGGVALPNISVSFISNGVVIGINLLPAMNGDRTTIIERTLGIWQEMLASFQPGTVVNPNPPCGG